MIVLYCGFLRAGSTTEAAMKVNDTSEQFVIFRYALPCLIFHTHMPCTEAEAQLLRKVHRQRQQDCTRQSKTIVDNLIIPPDISAGASNRTMSVIEPVMPTKHMV